MTDKEIGEVLDKAFNIEIISITENNLFINNKSQLICGSYLLNKDLSLKTGENLVKEGSKIEVKENTNPYGNIFGVDVFKVYHNDTKSYIYLTQGDIKDA
jgi:hypothetical protein